jgi:dTDP-glucose 4,6-dehydratase
LLVTGGSGFIGSNFIHHVLQGDPSANVLNVDAMTYAADPANLAGVDQAPGYAFAKADICDAERMDALVAGFTPDAIVHFAAESHVDRSIEAGDVFVRTNVLGTQVLLDVARRRDVPRFLHVSTDEVYGSRETGSFTELDGFHAASPYSASKAASDLLVLAHHRTYGLPVQITRCTNNYGPRQNPEKLLPKIITLARAGRPLPIYGDGLNVRDWLYVVDHCTAILAVMERGRAGEVYNVAARDERTNLEVARYVLKSLEKPESLITFVPDRPAHDRRYSLDDSKLRALGWAPRVPFEVGLRRTIDAYGGRA